MYCFCHSYVDRVIQALNPNAQAVPGMAALRAFRVLRALKAISAIPGQSFLFSHSRTCHIFKLENWDELEKRNFHEFEVEFKKDLHLRKTKNKKSSL